MLVFGIFIFIIGAIAASKFLSEKFPFLEKLFSLLDKFKGWMGFLAISWGVFSIIFSFSWPATLGRITLLIDGIVELIVGFILGYSIIARYFLSEKADAEQRAEAMMEKLKPFHTILGFIAMAMGLWTILYPFLFVNSIYNL